MKTLFFRPLGTKPLQLSLPLARFENPKVNSSTSYGLCLQYTLIHMHHSDCASGPLHIQFPASQILFSLLNDTQLLYQSPFKGHVHRKAFPTAVCKGGYRFILLFLILKLFSSEPLIYQ